MAISYKILADSQEEFKRLDEAVKGLPEKIQEQIGQVEAGLSNIIKATFKDLGNIGTTIYLPKSTFMMIEDRDKHTMTVHVDDSDFVFIIPNEHASTITYNFT